MDVGERPPPFVNDRAAPAVTVVVAAAVEVSVVGLKLPNLASTVDA